MLIPEETARATYIFVHSMDVRIEEVAEAKQVSLPLQAMQATDAIKEVRPQALKPPENHIHVVGCALWAEGQEGAA